MERVNLTVPEVMERVNLTVPEVMDRLRVSRSTLANWRVTGDGPPFMRFGRVVLYPLPELEAWERARIRRSTAEQA